ncbi:MAG: hypothetical protein LC105_06515 [Chitinophagales bacterium]|nr:hypothetical protein [Chitinophagales bacterium]MCZ2393488.1 hypothetical protein [Chitinophagales bacterium]
MFVSLDEMPEYSKVWLFPCSRKLTQEEISEVEKDVQQFVESWQSHGQKVTGSACICENQIICLIADDVSVGIGGCSLDSSTRVIKAIEEKLNIRCFERSLLLVQVENGVLATDFREIGKLIDQDVINEDSKIFNLLILTLQELREPWIKIKESAYSRFLPQKQKG